MHFLYHTDIAGSQNIHKAYILESHFYHAALIGFLTCQLLLQGGVFSLQAQKLSIGWAGHRARGGSLEALPLPEALILSLQLLNLGT